MRAILAFAAVLAASCTPAMAADGFLPAEVSGMLVEIVGTVLAALSGAVLMLLRKKLKLSVDDGHRGALLPALHAGLDYAFQRVKDADPADPVQRQDLIDEATAYVSRRVPDAAAHFGLDRPAMAELIEARLPVLLGPDDAVGVAGTIKSTVFGIPKG